MHTIMGFWKKIILKLKTVFDSTFSITVLPKVVV